VQNEIKFGKRCTWEEVNILIINTATNIIDCGIYDRYKIVLEKCCCCSNKQ